MLASLLCQKNETRHSMTHLFFYTALLIITGILPLNAFELKRVILATNNNPNYIQFWPIVAPLWEAMGIRPTLALIADEDCPIDTTLGDVIRFAPIPNVAESTQAQAIRLLLPALFPDDICIISDIDMLPISKSYFIKGAAHCPDNTFLVYRDCAHGCGYPHYPMCYNAAKGSVFGAIFNVSTLEDIRTMLSAWGDYGLGWNTDELLLYYFLEQWELSGGPVMRLGHGVGPRIDRLLWPQDLKSFDITPYIDCHCPRPYEQNAESINQIAKAVLKQLREEKDLDIGNTYQ